MFLGKVRETFYDIVDCRERRKGQEYQTETQERLDQLVALGLVVAVEQLELPPPPTETINKDTVGTAEQNAYNLMTKKELEELLTQGDIAFNGRQTKAQLIALLCGDK